MEVAKVSSKGQINIRILIRKHLNLSAGDKVLFIVDDESVKICNASSLNLTKEGGDASAKKV